LTLANGPKPSRTTRRFSLFEDVTDPRERRLAIMRILAMQLPFLEEEA
jgi:hypothetical protein